MKPMLLIRRMLGAEGTIGRGQFLISSLLLAMGKYGIDSTVSSAGFGRPWSVSYYWAGEQIQHISTATPSEKYYLGTMLLISIPFIWAGIVLFVLRLRSARAPLWLALLFFAPVINLLSCVVLCLLPDRRHAVSAPPLRRGNPLRIVSRFAWNAPSAIFGTAVFGTSIAVFDVYTLRVYGVGLFIGLPFCLGMMSSVLYGFGGIRSRKSCAGVAILSVTLTGLAMFTLALEGILCLFMAAPIWTVCAALGGIVGFTLQQRTRDQREAAVIVTAIAITLPVLMGVEALVGSPVPIRAVRTEVLIAAAPETVWRSVISFPEIDPPGEWMFRLGVAYPIDATIIGRGPGAERRCNFSTGSFVEPIDVWDEPRLLRFSVTENPPPLRELSLFENIAAPHLHGFLASRAGQFHLERMADGTTRLEGTTWYQNQMSPSMYWSLWSDSIIHRIHLRVLEHIRSQCEREESFVRL